MPAGLRDGVGLARAAHDAETTTVASSSVGAHHWISGQCTSGACASPRHLGRTQPGTQATSSQAAAGPDATTSTKQPGSGPPPAALMTSHLADPLPNCPSRRPAITDGDAGLR